MSRNAQLGKEALIYFRSISLDPFTGKQRILIPPVHQAPTPNGYVRCEANSVKELESVSREFEAQKRSDFGQVDEIHLQRVMAKMTAIRKRLNARLLSADCNQFERDFIRLSLIRLQDGEKNLQPRRIEGYLGCEATEVPVH